MGLNLIVYELVPRRTDFDTIRHVGDTDFVSANEIDKQLISLGHPRDGEMVWRPENISAAKEWVKVNIVEENQKRLLDVLSKMENNLSLYFYESW